MNLVRGEECMSVIENILNGILVGAMIWIVVIFLIVVWVFFGAYIQIAILIILAYFTCKNACRLFGVLGSAGRTILAVAIIMFLAFCSQNIMNIPMWFGASIVVTLAYHIKKTAS